MASDTENIARVGLHSIPYVLLAYRRSFLLEFRSDLLVLIAFLKIVDSTYPPSGVIGTIAVANPYYGYE